MKPWQHLIESPDPIISTLLSLEGFYQVFPRIEFYGLLSNGNRMVGGRGQTIRGIEESQVFHSLNVEEGRNLSSESDGIMLGKGLAQALGLEVVDAVSVLANTVRGSMNGLDLVVSGIFHTGMKDFDDHYFRIQLQKGQELLSTTRLESIAIGLKDTAEWAPFEAYVKENFPGLEAVSFADLDKTYYQHTVDLLAAQFEFIRAIILAIVFLGILNAISSSILERKQEFGNLRANGHSRWEVFKIISFEGMMLGLVGSVLGILVTYGMTEILLQKRIDMPPGPGQTRAIPTYIELQGSMVFQTRILGCFSPLLGSVSLSLL